MPLRKGKAAFADVLQGVAPRGAWIAGSLGDLSFARAFAIEWEQRRPFLWLPVAAGAGVALYFAADREPVLWLPLLLGGIALLACWLTRRQPLALALSLGALALVAGFLAAELRARAVATPMLDRIRILHLTGTIEEVDRRPEGSRFLMSIADGGGLDPAHRPRLIRLTTKQPDRLEAGQAVAVTARLLPPSRAALPGEYDFARDAYFSGIGAVGSALGRLRSAADSPQPGWRDRLRRSLDRSRNDLAERVSDVVGHDDTGAIAAAMVTGKRDLLSADGRDIIRQAGIFHIITIAGVQMTLVAGLLFGTVRRLLALSPALALRYPIKSWAAWAAIVGAIAYDIGTGSRVGTQRALFMTLIMLTAVLAGRRALTMRNLAFAALAVIAIEPEQIAGASFQLSFAAVAALIAVQEARSRHEPEDLFAPAAPRAMPSRPWVGRLRRGGTSVVHLFTATLCATLGTASFMAAAFHELSPYVFIGNPLTLAMIEIFAVPGALLGTLLYPLGLDAPVWHWVGWGIRIVMAVARHLAEAPASTVHFAAFAPWALPCLAMAFLSVVIWQTVLLRCTAVPWLVLGLIGASSGHPADLVVAPTGEAVALRTPDGSLGVLGKASGFTIEQWLRADGDARPALKASLPVPGSRCDRLACVSPVAGGGTLSLVTDTAAFAEDCLRADIVVTSLVAPASCGAKLVIDRFSLEMTGAVSLERDGDAWSVRAARAVGEDRPWSPAPLVRMPHRPRVRPGAAPATDDPASIPIGEAEPVRLP